MIQGYIFISFLKLLLKVLIPMFFMDNIIEVSQNVQEHLSIRIPINPVFNRQQTPSNLGQAKYTFHHSSPQRTHQKTHRSGHPIFSPINNGHKCNNSIHHLPTKLERNSWNKITLSRHDHQKCNHHPIQLKKYFTFEVQVLDDKNVRRRFRASNYQSTTRVKPFICTMPMRLD